jgi:hypothetical protein
MMPERYRKARFAVVDEVMPAGFSAELGEWFGENRQLFVRGGDPQGLSRYNYEITDLDRHCDLLAPFHAMIVEQFPKALEACDVPDFELRYIETHATLYHHGSHFVWHDDAPAYGGTLAPTRRVTFCFYMHTLPKMFEGGELEFLDGTRVEPMNNRLVFFHPLQQHQVRRVECWSAEQLHGRWALMGWVHGDPPPGYVEAIPEMRGRPYGN